MWSALQDYFKKEDFCQEKSLDFGIFPVRGARLWQKKNSFFFKISSASAPEDFKKVSFFRNLFHVRGARVLKSRHFSSEKSWFSKTCKKVFSATLDDRLFWIPRKRFSNFPGNLCSSRIYHISHSFWYFLV